MTTTKRYAIRCSTEEDAIECREKHNWKYIFFCKDDSDYNPRMIESIIESWYTIISYAEAVEKGLLGEKIATVCKACLWKKQVSVFTWPTVCGSDFIGDKGYVVDKWWIKMVDCSRCHGTGLEKEHHKLNINTSSIDSVEPSKDFGKSENVVEKIMKEIYNEWNRRCYEWLELWICFIEKILEKHLSNK